MRVLLAGPGTGKTTRIKSIVREEFSPDDRILILSFTNATVSDLSDSFSEFPNVECMTLHGYAFRINHLTDRYVLNGRPEEDPIKALAAKFEMDFGFVCSRLGCITFDDMVRECLRFLRENPVYGNEKIGSLDLLIVDEYQDFNPVERELIDEIATHAAETMILGDDDQSIYGFKDADPDGIIDITKRPGVVEIEHEHKCYRCPDSVVEQASRLIGLNKHRLEKPWIPTGRGGDIVFGQFATQDETNKYVVSEIRAIRASDPDSSLLVLSPVHYCIDGLMDLLKEHEIPYVDWWSSKLDPATQRLVWWIRAIYTDQKVLNLAFLTCELTGYARGKVWVLLGKALQEGWPDDALLREMLKRYDPTLAEYVLAPPPLDQLTATNPEFSELVEKLDESDLPGSAAGLEAALNPRPEFAEGAVNIMSIHKSKGLQADNVFINGLVDGVLPNGARGVDSIEAQRRVLFVGVTRAKSKLYLLAPIGWDGKQVNKVNKEQFEYDYKKKAYNGRTSQFVGEMIGR